MDDEPVIERKFGPTGRDVAIVGQGTWQMRDAKAAGEALRVGLELGMTHIDTAELYKGSEEVIAPIIAGRRDEVFLVSKVLPHHASYQGTLDACEASLRRVGTDHLDVYLRTRVARSLFRRKRSTRWTRRSRCGRGYASSSLLPVVLDLFLVVAAVHFLRLGRPVGHRLVGWPRRRRLVDLRRVVRGLGRLGRGFLGHADGWVGGGRTPSRRPLDARLIAGKRAGVGAVTVPDFTAIVYILPKDTYLGSAYGSTES